MNLLLDTHTLLWFFNGSSELSGNAKSAIENPENLKFISIASLLEIAIKISLKKLKVEKGYKNIAVLIDENGFEILPLSVEHGFELSRLVFHHRDPFDRMIISQAKVEDFIVVTKDQIIMEYGIKTLW